VPTTIPATSSTTNGSGANIQLQLAPNSTTAKIGETVTFTITIINTGSRELTNVLLSSEALGISSAAVYGGKLGTGIKAIIEGTYTLTDDDLPGPLQVTARVVTNEAGTVEATVEVEIVGRLDEATPEVDPIYIGQTVTWQPILACERKCVRWELYQTNQTGNWEIFRLGELDTETDANANISGGEGPNVDDITPSQSPNGEWIAFSSNRDGNWEIYLARNDGTGLQRLTENVTASDLNPVWGPNNYIVYQSNRDGDWNLYLLDAATGIETRITDSSADDINPAWSPDGSTIAFQTNRDGRWQIYALKPQIGAVKQLSNGDRNDYEPVYSPDGRSIAFRSVLDGKTSSNVFIMGEGGGSIIPVNNFEGSASHPTWSADSRLLAYQSDVDGDSEIYTYDLATGAIQQLTDNDVDDTAPSFLCDGTDLTFNSDSGGKTDIYQLDARSPDQAPQQLTDNAGDNLGGLSALTNAEKPAAGHDGRPAYPTLDLAPGAIEPVYPRLTAWSPVNACETTCPAWSVYTAKVGDNWQIFRQDESSAQPVSLSQPNDDNSNLEPDNLMPSVSPNGEWVVFASNRDKYWELYIASTDGSVLPRRVTYSKAYERNPVWSPGGQSVVYESDRDGNWELYKFDITTGAEEQLTFNAGDDTHARWSPDASRIVFQSNRTGISQIYVLDLQTGLITALSDGKTDDSQAVYAPDGQTIAYRSVQAGQANGVMVLRNLDGTTSPISDAAGDASEPVWAADSFLLAYQSSSENGRTIALYDWLTGETRELVAPGLNAFAPAWRCGGTTLLFNVGTGDETNVYVLNDLLAEQPLVDSLDNLPVLSSQAGGKIFAPYTADTGSDWLQATVES